MKIMEPVEELSDKSSSKVTITSLAVYYMFMAISSAVINVTDWTFYNSSGYGMVMHFALSMIVIWSMVFYGARYGVYRLLELALGLWLIFIICWMYIVMLNLKDNYGFYCVNRRCPNSFWIVISKLNKLPIDNAFDYYYHQPHKSADEYDNFHPLKNATQVAPKVAEFRSRLDWLSIDFSNYLMQTTTFIILCLIFAKSWMYLKYSLWDLKNRTLCPDCYMTGTSAGALQV